MQRLQSRSYQPQHGTGVEGPTDNIRFIFTSNTPLYPANGTATKQNQKDQAAIRDRVNYRDFDLSWQNHWGWAAHIVMDPGFVTGPGIVLTVLEKESLLDFMWKYWSKMGSTSMREIESMAADIKNFPTDYYSMWERRIGL